MVCVQGVCKTESHAQQHDQDLSDDGCVSSRHGAMPDRHGASHALLIDGWMDGWILGASFDNGLLPLMKP
jgi:hypothetical protein